MSKKLFILPGLNGDALFLNDFRNSLLKASLTIDKNDKNQSFLNLENTVEENKIKLENIHSDSKRIIPIQDEIEDVIVKENSPIHNTEKNEEVNFVLIDDPDNTNHFDQQKAFSHEASHINISTPYIKNEWDIEIIEYPKNQILTYPELQEYVFKKVIDYHEFYVLAESFSGPIAASLATLCHDSLKGIIFAASFIETPLLLANVGSKIFNKLPFMNSLHKVPFHMLKHLLLNNYHDVEVEEKIKEFLLTAKEEVIQSRIKEVVNLNQQFLNSYNDAYASFNGKVLSIVAGQDKLLSKFSNFPLPVFDEKMLQATHFSYKIANRIPQTQIAYFKNAPHMILELYPDKMAQEIMNWLENS